MPSRRLMGSWAGVLCACHQMYLAGNPKPAGDVARTPAGDPTPPTGSPCALDYGDLLTLTGEHSGRATAGCS